MGKRELLIIVGFVVIGTLAYQLTAPAATSSEGFSLSKIWNELKREVHGNPSSATTTKTGTHDVGPALTEVRFSSVSRLRVVGEDRNDLAYELKVESNGPDEKTALEYAKRVLLKTDDLGTTLTFRVEYPSEARQTSELTVKVPLRLAIRVQGGANLEASNLSSLRLEGVGSQVKIQSIAGAVTGTHRGGELEVNGASNVRLTLQGSHATFHDITDAIALDVRNAECELTGTKATIEIEQINSRVTIVAPASTVRVGGERGRITIEAPSAETSVDVRRAEIEVLVRKPVPLTLVTTDEELRLLLDGPPAIAVDAVAPDGSISTPGLDLKPETVDKDVRLAHVFGEAPKIRASLRNLRGEIVIRMAK
jgi:hypothetical protein